jgi:hypothetical protein
MYYAILTWLIAQIDSLHSLSFAVKAWNLPPSSQHVTAVLLNVMWEPCTRSDDYSTQTRRWSPQGMRGMW